ncbi:MAG: hypothetical protein EOL88_02040 [Bacteroidia bacterium]|nr:hypothetical protein [Bacteroidia bacterium]
MDKDQIIQYLSAIDTHLDHDAMLVIYGSAAFILLDEDERSSLDMDVAGPYSSIQYDSFCEAAKKAGLEVNPENNTDKEHIEWISALRLCLARPDPQTEITLWQGRRLWVKTVAPEDLVVSKLIRYDDIDVSDIRYLVAQMNLEPNAIVAAVERLPRTFKNDVWVRENLENLLEDMLLWKS